MTAYLLLKWIHIVSAAVLFGTGLGIAFFQWATYKTGNVAAVATVTKLVVRADFWFTAPAVVVQLASGLLLLHVMSLPWTTAWAVAALLLYVLVGACWLPVVAIQVRLARNAQHAAHAGTPLPSAFHRDMRTWFRLGWPAFLGMLAIFWLMVHKPTTLSF